MTKKPKYASGKRIVCKTIYRGFDSLLWLKNKKMITSKITGNCLSILNGEIPILILPKTNEIKSVSSFNEVERFNGMSTMFYIKISFGSYNEEKFAYSDFETWKAVLHELNNFLSRLPESELPTE